MNSNVKSLISFIAGAAIGCLATWKYFKDTSEKKAQDDIYDARKAFSDRTKELRDELDKLRKIRDDAPEETPDIAKKKKASEMNQNKKKIVEYNKIISESSYSSSQDKDESEDEPDEDRPEIERSDEYPRIIAPEELGEYDDYEVAEYRYLSDHTLLDENLEKVDDVENTVGYDSLERFGEYEPDAIFVRNDRLRMDIEVLMDERTYDDVLSEQEKGR